ncbi:MAG: hypothetical protein WD184_02735 [Acidimicrobiia bacterium]
MPRLLVVIAIAAATLVPSGPSEASSTGVTAWEQWVIYEINRARWNPGQYAAETGISIPQLGALPPLALSQHLDASADFKAIEMAGTPYFAHQHPLTMEWPNELVRSHLFPLPSFILDNANNVEAIWGGSGGWPSVATFLESPNHRDALFGASGHWWWESVNQVGVGRAESGGQRRVAVHVARTDPLKTFVTGVAYADANGNGRMDLNEGLAGVTITVGNTTALTNAGGGYSIAVQPGTTSVKASGPGFAGAPTASIHVDQFNVGVDFISGVPTPEVRAFAKCDGARPTIMGTAASEAIRGTSADDIIHGLDASDRIWGYAGDDTICGGKGKDRLRGGSGNDDLFGGNGKDQLFGGLGTNHLDGGNGTKDKCLQGNKVRCEV